MMWSASQLVQILQDKQSLDQYWMPDLEIMTRYPTVPQINRFLLKLFKTTGTDWQDLIRDVYQCQCHSMSGVDYTH